eukprot:g4932.t1
MDSAVRNLKAKKLRHYVRSQNAKGSSGSESLAQLLFRTVSLPEIGTVQGEATTCSISTIMDAITCVKERQRKERFEKEKKKRRLEKRNLRRKYASMPFLPISHEKRFACAGKYSWTEKFAYRVGEHPEASRETSWYRHEQNADLVRLLDALPRRFDLAALATVAKQQLPYFAQQDEELVKEAVEPAFLKAKLKADHSYVLKKSLFKLLKDKRQCTELGPAFASLYASKASWRIAMHSKFMGEKLPPIGLSSQLVRNWMGSSISKLKKDTINDAHGLSSLSVAKGEEQQELNRSIAFFTSEIKKYC